MCFGAGTTVTMCDGSLRAIETIAVGDLVQSRADDGRIECSPVEQTFVHDDASVVTAFWATSAGEFQTFRATLIHPFWVVGRGWTRLGDIAVGDVAWTPEGKEFRFEGRTAEEANLVTVYNLEVAGNHNYFVGEHRILVHNKIC
jgi:hypothetical protein